LRPTNNREALEFEISFWRGLGDDRRAELLEERLAELPVDGQQNIVALSPSRVPALLPDRRSHEEAYRESS
jgi:hypothetical protein